MSIFSDRAEPWTGLIRKWRSPLTRADNNEIHFQPKKNSGFSCVAIDLARSCQEAD